MFTLCEGCNVACALRVLLGTVGLVAVLNIVFQPLLQFVFRTFSRAPCFSTRFGQWAIVTGCTDGIGEALALKLARQGMSLLLISRDPKKLEATQEKITQAVPKCETKTFIFDFALNSASWTDPSGSSKLQSLIDSLDVGMLFNNVGLSYPSALKFEELPIGLNDELISVNLRSVYHLTRMVLPGMRRRHRGAIVCTGSGASIEPTEPLYAGYCGVKAGVECFCRSLQMECVTDNILVQCQTPLLVATKMSRIRNASLTVLSTEDYAVQAIQAVEKSYPSSWLSTTVCPASVHNLQLRLSNFIPLGVWNKMRYQATSAIRDKFLKRSKSK